MFRRMFPASFVRRRSSLPHVNHNTDHTNESLILYRDLFQEANSIACDEHRKHMIRLLRMQLEKHRQSGVNSHDSPSFLEHGYKILGFLRSLNLHKPRHV